MPIYLFSFLNFLPQIIETAYKAFCTYFGLEWFIYFLFFKNTFPLLLFSFSFKTLSVFIPSSSIFSNIVEDPSLWPNVYIFCWIMHVVVLKIIYIAIVKYGISTKGSWYKEPLRHLGNLSLNFILNIFFPHMIGL